MFKTSSSQKNVNWKAVGWALLSQTIWLPPLLTEVNDSLASKNRDYDFSSIAKIPNQQLPQLSSRKNLLATGSPTSYSRSLSSSASSGFVLKTQPSEILGKVNSFSGNTHDTTQSFLYKYSPSPTAYLPSNIHTVVNIDSGMTNSNVNVRNQSNLSSNLGFIEKLYSKSDLLGGILTLADIDEPIMPPLAKAERAKLLRSQDPLAPIPGSWREPMRKALNGLMEISPKSIRTSSNLTGSSTLGRLEQARVIHVLSTKVKQLEEVPLALQSDGSVDILSKPADPAVIQEIADWTTKQKLPSSGQIQPAVVHLHPMDAANNPKISEYNKDTPLNTEVRDDNLPRSNYSSKINESKTTKNSIPSTASSDSVFHKDTLPSSAAELDPVKQEHSIGDTQVTTEAQQ